MTRFRHYIEYVFLRGVAAVIRLLPFSFVMKLARLGGRVLYFLLKKYRRVAHENIKMALSSEMNEDQIKRLVIESFENLAMFALEFIFIPKMAKNTDRYLQMEGGQYVKEALKKGKGVVVVLAHSGNWEWMAVLLGMNFPIQAVARPLRNPFVYDYIKKLRGITGLRSIDKRGAIRQSLKMISRNEVVCVLIDQHERQASVRVPFFGREASTPTLPALLALKRGAVVLPLFYSREKKLPSRMFFSEPFKLIQTGNDEQDILENTKQYVARIEEEVRKRPAEWLWMHRRWR